MESWEAGCIRHQHQDGTFKIRFEGGRAESNVSSDRISIARGMLRTLSSFASSFDSLNTASFDGGGERDVSGHAGMGVSCDLDMSGHSADGHSLSSVQSNLSHLSAREWIERSKLSSDAQAKIEFVVDFTHNDEDWLETSDEENEAVDKTTDPAVTPPLVNPALNQDSSVSSTTSIMDSSRHTATPNGSEASPSIPFGSATFTVEFPVPPMGFSLNKSGSGHAHVTKITPGGQASNSQIRLGDCVVDINGTQITGYDGFMRSMLTVSYPAVVTFLRKRRTEKQNTSGPSALAQASIGKDNMMLTDACVELAGGLNMKVPVPAARLSQPSMGRSYSEPTGSSNSNGAISALIAASPVASKLTLHLGDNFPSIPPQRKNIGLLEGELRDICFREV